MPKVSVDGVSLNYRCVGSGEPVVLIHGLAANHAFWNLKLLLPLAREYQVCTYDLRGHGYSDMPDTGYSTRDMVGDVVGLLDELDIESAHLVGHSYGGVVALHCAVLHAERVKSLTLQDSRIRALQPTQRLIDWPDWREAKKKLDDLGIVIDEHEDEVGVKLLECLASPKWRRSREELRSQPLFIPFSGWAAGNRSAARWLKLLETTSVRQDIRDAAGLTREAIAGVDKPTLAIYGEHSRCMRTYDGLLDVLPGCQGYIMPNVGHFYPVIRPVAVAKLISEFIDSQLAARPTPFSRPNLHDVKESIWK